MTAHIRIRQRDGSFRWALNRFRPHTAANGDVLRWFGVMIDVHDERANAEKRGYDRAAKQFIGELDAANTQLARATSELQNATRLINTLHDTVPLATAILNLDETIAIANPRLCDLMGVAQNEMLGEHFAGIVAPYALPFYELAVAQARESLGSVHTAAAMNAGGNIVEVNMWIALARSAGGAPQSLIVHIARL